MTEARAIIFDLDDTLYPLRRFQLSGFRAVALHLEREADVPAARAFAVLRRAFATGHRGRELQVLCDACALPRDIVPALVAIIREHQPSLRFPAASARVLDALRPSWRLGVLTNGLPSVQARKTHALGLSRRVDAVVYAAQCGDGRGKPAPEGFLAVLQALGVEPASAVFVGDNEDTDVAGAAAVGMKTILLTSRVAAWLASPASHDAWVTTLDEVPLVAANLIEPWRHFHAV